MPETLTTDYTNHDSKIRKNTERYRQGTFLHSAEEAQATQPLRFPGKLTPYEPDEDTRIAIKRDLMKQDMPFGQIFQEPEDVAWVIRKQQNARELQDYKMFIDQYDLANPAELKMAQDGCPQFFDALEKQVELDAELQLRLAKMAIRGQKGFDDFILLSQILRGEIACPSGPLWAPNPINNSAMESYNYGMFNPRKNALPIDTTVGSNKEALNFLAYLTNRLIVNSGTGTNASTTKLNMQYLPTARIDFNAIDTAPLNGSYTMGGGRANNGLGNLGSLTGGRRYTDPIPPPRS